MGMEGKGEGVSFFSNKNLFTGKDSAAIYRLLPNQTQFSIGLSNVL